MDTFIPIEPTVPGPVPTRPGRGGPSRRRTLATSLAVAGLTATGGLAVILSTAATSGAAGTAAITGDGPALATSPQASAATDGTASPAATTAPGTAQNGSSGQTLPVSRPQPPQSGQGGGPGHAATGGS